jgi:hypothetical protein
MRGCRPMWCTGTRYQRHKARGRQRMLWAGARRQRRMGCGRRRRRPSGPVWWVRARQQRRNMQGLRKPDEAWRMNAVGWGTTAKADCMRASGSRLLEASSKQQREGARPDPDKGLGGRKGNPWKARMGQACTQPGWMGLAHHQECQLACCQKNQLGSVRAQPGWVELARRQGR